MARANVYVDGFNLFYGAVRGTPYRWLDLGRFCSTVFPSDQIIRIRYFTALVTSPAGDPTKQQRQQAYIRALLTIPELSVHYGRFSLTTKSRLLAQDPTRTVQVLQQEEKGSDVNLASHLLMDGFRGEYEVAIVVSNDSDLLEPIRMVRNELGLKVGILNPYKRSALDLKG